MNEVILMLAICIMSYGAYQDIKTRKFPNKVCMIAFFLGLLYSGMNSHIFPSLFLFIFMNIIGVFAHEKKFLNPGDVKFISICMFFLNTNDWKVILCFIINILIIGLGYGLIYPILHYKTRDEMKEHYITEIKNITYFIYLKSPVVSKKYENDEEMKNNTHPFTVQLLCSFLLTLSLNNILV